MSIAGPLARWSGLLLSTLLQIHAAQAQSYENVDSIQVHGLVFLGKVEFTTYTYTDSIRCQFTVANRSPDPVTVDGPPCDALFNLEVWCDSSDVQWNCTPVEPILRGCGDIPIGGLTVPPGEHILETRTFVSRQPAGGTWFFRTGWAVFVNPWPEFSPYFEFAIRYSRVPGITLLNEASWSAVKQWYR